MSTFRGLLTAIVTPFRDGAVDEAAHRALVQRQLAGGVDGLVPCGTTGESPTLSGDEQARVVAWTLEEAAGQVPVMAGIGSNDTAKAIANARRVAPLGVRGVLATAPYYNKPTQEGLFRHFCAVAEAVPDLEVCVYDVPGRTAVHVEPETLARLSSVDNITCVKDATGDMANATEIRRLCGDRLALLSGDDFTALPFLLQGGDGVVSVASNVTPDRMAALVNAALGGRLDEARTIHLRLFPLFTALFLESNPAPTKAALHAMGLCADELRLPLCEMSAPMRARLLAVLAELDLA